MAAVALGELVPDALRRVVVEDDLVDLLQARIRAREASDPGWFLEAAAHTVQVLEQARVEDHLVGNADRPPAEVAEEVLRLVGWLRPSAGA